MRCSTPAIPSTNGSCAPWPPAPLFINEVRCPVSVTDLAAALLELAAAPHAGVCHIGSAGAISRYGLGLLIASRDGLDLPRSRRPARPPASRARSTCGWTAPRPGHA
jgi:dTDP-4-dehydrorhamnose reductase